MKGRQDPNMHSYARQNIQKLPQIHQLSQMSVHELVVHKSDVSVFSKVLNFIFPVQLEVEYQRLPITVSGKSIQVRKRKEELEFELDTVEKQIYRARQRSAI